MRGQVGRGPGHVTTVYLRCVTPGASTARTCSSCTFAAPALSKRRAPSPSSTATTWSSSSFNSPWADRFGGASQVLLERIKPRRPLRSIRLQPGVELHQRFWTESVQPPLSILPDLHQPGVAQHLEVTRHTWLMHPDLLDQLTDRPLAVPDGVKDPSPCRFSDHFEDRDFCWHGAEHTLWHIYVQPYVEAATPIGRARRASALELRCRARTPGVTDLTTPLQPAPESASICLGLVRTERCPRTRGSPAGRHDTYRRLGVTPPTRQTLPAAALA